MRRRGRTLARMALLTLLGTVLGFSVTMCLQGLGLSSEDDIRQCALELAETISTKDLVDRKVENFDSSLPPRNFLFAGVMTAQKYVNTRAYEIYRSWAQNLIANGSIAFFVSSTTECDLDESMPLIRLAGVDDSYPPQKKSLSMLKYMYENYLNQYEWFMRADDDVYVRLDKLEVFLRSLNSSQPLFIGQAGLGTPEEYGQLHLGEGDNYCMGGPGMILSRETLRRIGPHIVECLGSMMTTHEDVEVGRCINRFSVLDSTSSFNHSVHGVTCTWSYEMQTLFYNNQSGVQAYTGDLNVPEVHHAITLHPVKQQPTIRRLHAFMRGVKLSDLRFRSLQLSRDVLSSLRELVSSGDTINRDEIDKLSDYALVPSLTKSIPYNHDDLLTWEFLSPNIAFCFGAPNCPRHNIESYWRYSTVNVIRQVMDIVNKYARQRGRVLEYQEILYGYRRVDPTHGADYIFDLLLLYKKFKGSRMTIPVRRHAYLQQSFGRLQLIEDLDDDALQFDENDPSASSSAKKKYVHIILPLSGRSSTFQRFVDLFEKTCLQTGELVKLYVVLFSSSDVNRTTDEERLIFASIRRLQTIYAGSHEIRLFQLNGTFSRGAALSFGASRCSSGALMFFTDVDVVFSRDFIRRLRSNTIRGRRVYFPIVFSQYAVTKSKKERTLSAAEFDFSRIDYDSENGYFRHFGYGLLGVYRSDFDAIGGFDLTIRGWGMEDVDLFDKFVKKSNLTILRAPDPDLIHVYHQILCDSWLAPSQFQMCHGSKADSLASARTLSDAFYNAAQFFSLFPNGADSGDEEKFSKAMVGRMLKKFL